MSGVDPTGLDAQHPLVTPVVPGPPAPAGPDPTGVDAQHPLTTPVVPPVSR